MADGGTIRLVPAPPGKHACHARSAARTVPPGGPVVRLPGRVVAWAGSGQRIVAALEGGELLEIDAQSQPPAPRPIPHRGPVEALAVNGANVYVLDGAGLAIFDLAAPEARLRVHDPTLHGRSLEALGRTLRIVADDGSIVSYTDPTAAPLDFEVSIGDDSFSPQELTIAVGDTVRWTNTTGDLHNVVSCSEAQFGCNGASATETFTSGPATEFWELEHTFTQAGENPYLCQPHATFMTGSVTVIGSSGAPPGVSDGTSGSPLRVRKLAVDGSSLEVSWDTSCAGAADHQILYGYAFGLPGSTGGGYELSGSRCAIGTTSPFAWSATPPAFSGPTGWVWWLIVATDGAATEGSWGEDSADVERDGTGVGGASGECGCALKSLTNSCGH